MRNLKRSITLVGLLGLVGCCEPVDSRVEPSPLAMPDPSIIVKPTESVAKLDEADFGTDRYVLEVATPGLDYPLKLNRQFLKNIGRGLKVHGKDKSILQGKLMAADEECMTLRQETKVGKTVTEKVVILRFEDVEKAFVLVSFK